MFVRHGNSFVRFVRRQHTRQCDVVLDHRRQGNEFVKARRVLEKRNLSSSIWQRRTSSTIRRTQPTRSRQRRLETTRTTSISSSSQSRKRRLRIGAATIGTIGAGSAYTLYALSIEWDDVKEWLGLEEETFTEIEKKELEALDKVEPIEAPEIIASHPFQQRNVLWRFFFTLRRSLYLLRLFVPVAAYGLY